MVGPEIVERAKTAKIGATENEMRRTRVLMDKISGKHNVDKKYTNRPESTTRR